MAARCWQGTVRHLTLKFSHFLEYSVYAYFFKVMFIKHISVFVLVSLSSAPQTVKGFQRVQNKQNIWIFCNLCGFLIFNFNFNIVVCVYIYILNIKMHYVKNLQFYGKNKGFFIKKRKKRMFL